MSSQGLPSVYLCVLISSKKEGKNKDTSQIELVHPNDLRFHGGSDGKESTCSGEDLGSIPGLERSPGEGDGYPFQYFCLENPMAGYSS